MDKLETLQWAEETICNDLIKSVFIFVVDYIFDNQKETEDPLSINDINKFYGFVFETWNDCLQTSEHYQSTKSNDDCLSVAMKLFIEKHINKIFDINVNLYDYVNAYKRTIPIRFDFMIFNLYYNDKHPNAKIKVEGGGYLNKRYNIKDYKIKGTTTIFRITNKRDEGNI